jgi:hypothetical protein
VVDEAVEAGVWLLWIPLGAGSKVPVVHWNGLAYEAIMARRERRPRSPLFHAALEVAVDGERSVVEMTPAWGAAHTARGAVAGGPVGARTLGRSRLFRYEVHCWRDGVIPDRDFAVGGARRVAGEAATARRVLALAPQVPTPVWGRDELGTGEMWNSNSLVAWLLVRAGIPTRDLAPPGHGRAPGWNAGLVVAARSAVQKGGVQKGGSSSSGGGSGSG